jgi:hypothetical protein
MSAVLNLKPQLTRPGLSLVQSQLPVASTRTRGKLGFSATLLIGSVVIALLNLGLNMATSTGVYEVANLKAQKAKLDLSSQIVAQKVDSLSSNQNLASAAQAMGMVANANPVFLDLSNQKVYGSPAAATQNLSQRVSGNLVANAQWSTKTDMKQVQSALAAEEAKATQRVAASVATLQSVPASKTKPDALISTGSNLGAGYVGGAKSSTPQVGLANSGIPTAPTH